jgi:plasmid stabilization system protein ParE
MNSNTEQNLLAKLRALSPKQITEVEDIMDFIAVKRSKQAAWNRLLSIAPALEAAGLPPITQDQVLADVQAVRTEQRKPSILSLMP